MKTMVDTQKQNRVGPEWWWNDSSVLAQVADYLIKNNILITAEDVFGFYQKPSAFNKEYELWQKRNLSFRTTVRPKTNQFFSERFYPVGDDWLESITTILSTYPSPGLVHAIGEYGNVEMEIRKRVKGDRGSRVHDALQQNMILDREYYDDEEWLSLIHAKQFHEEYKPKLILNEQWCWSIKHHYAGRFDRIVQIDGKTVLIDWKTGFVGREAELQLAAEKRAIEEMHPIQIDDVAIVALNDRTKKGWSYKPLSGRSEYKEAMLSTPSSVQTMSGEELLKGMKERERKAFEEVIAADLVVFDALHVTWRDLFKARKPKEYPFDVVPEKLDLSIPLTDEEIKIPELPKSKTNIADAIKTVVTDAGGDFGGTKENVEHPLVTALRGEGGAGGGGGSTGKDIQPPGTNVAQGQVGTIQQPEQPKQTGGDKVVPVIDELYRGLAQFVDVGTQKELEAWYNKNQPNMMLVSRDELKQFGKDYANMLKKVKARKKK